MKRKQVDSQVKVFPKGIMVGIFLVVFFITLSAGNNPNSVQLEKVPKQERLFLDNLNKRINQTLKKVPFLTWNTLGYAIEANRIVGIGLYQKNLNSWPEGIWELGKLKYLYVVGNRLNPIPKEICNLKQLEEVWLNVNQLSEIPECFFDLVHLRRVCLYHNQITHLPDEIGNLKKLTELHLASNQIQELPDAMAKLITLKILDISNNPINNVEQIVAGLKNLEILAITGIKVNKPLNFLTHLTKLKRLRVYPKQYPFIPEKVKSREDLKIISK